MSKRTRQFPATVLVSLAVFLVSGLAAFFVFQYYAASVLKKEIDRQIKSLSRNVKVEYESLKVEPLTFFVTLEKVKLSNPPLTGVINIEAVRIRDFTCMGITVIPTTIKLDNFIAAFDKSSLEIQHLETKFSLQAIPPKEQLSEDPVALLRHLRNSQTEIEKVSYRDRESELQVERLTVGYARKADQTRQLELKINSVRLQAAGMAFTTAAWGCSVSLDSRNVVQHLSQSVDHLSFPLPEGGPGGQGWVRELRKLGYERLCLGGDFTYRYEAKTRHLSLGWLVRGTDLGRLEFHFQLGEFASPAFPLEGDPTGVAQFLEGLEEALLNAALVTVKLAYQDWGLVPRLLQAEARARGETPEALVRNLLRALDAALLLLPGPPSLREQVGALRDFLREPREIHLELTAKSPCRLRDLERGGLEGLLGFLSRAELKITAR